MITIPRTEVVPLAVAAALRAKTVAWVLGVLTATCVAWEVQDIVERSAERDDAAAAFWVVVIGIACAFAVRRVRRRYAASRRAGADAGSTWTLTDKLVVATDDRGQPVPEHSFKVPRRERDRLVAAYSGAR